MIFEGYRVEVTARSSCRHMKLRRVGQDAYFRLSVPPHATQREITAFLRGVLPWMEKTLPRTSLQDWQPRFAPGERHLALGRRLTLGENGVPCGSAFLTWRSRLLQQVLERQLSYWQSRMGVRASRVQLREMNSRWGSCTASTGAIRFSVKLGALPEELIESVVVHELTHLRHADHSSAFYAEMARYLPDWKEKRARLNAFDARPLPPL